MERIPRMSVSEATYLAVKKVLLSSKYAPGARVDIDGLCHALDVSRTPVFDALNRLEAEGLVQIVPRKGVYLVMLSEKKARELYVLREYLEGAATRLAAKNITDQQIDQLKRMIDRQFLCLEKGDTEGYANSTISLHNTIAVAARNETLEHLLGTVYSQMNVLRLGTLYMPKRLRHSFAEHQRIFQAIIKRDPDLCEHVARKHVAATTEYALGILVEPTNGPREQRSSHPESSKLNAS